MTPVRDILGIVFITRLVHRKQKLVHTMKAIDPRMLNVIFKAINYFNICGWSKTELYLPIVNDMSSTLLKKKVSSH